MKLLSKESIIFYSILGAFAGFVELHLFAAYWILALLLRSQLQQQ